MLSDHDTSIECLLSQLNIERSEERFVSNDAVDLHHIKMIDLSLLNRLSCCRDRSSDAVANRFEIALILV